MELYLPFYLFVTFLLHSCEAFIGLRFWKFTHQVEQARERLTQKHITQLYKENGHMKSPVKTYYLEQPLDHFNAMSKEWGKVYKQRYYVNPEYWFGPTSPVFLFIGGEGTLSSRYVEVGEMVDLGKKHGALLLGVEHRFYGASLNDDGLQLEELQYLSSQQALADLAAFVDAMKQKFGIPDTAPWICFGGSYPGALSAWFRLKYPHLVHGAVASSAPVQAVVNFEGYNEVVAASLKSTIVGGSEECLDSVKKSFQIVDSMITAQRFDKLQKDFKSCGPVDASEDTVLFVSNLAGYFMGVVQYNNEIPGQNVSHVCDVMLSSSDPYANLVKLNQESLDLSNETCSDNSYLNYTATMSNTTVNPAAVGPGIRQWTYQTCSQFGYYQTCDEDTSCPFSHLMNLPFSDLQLCEKVFKINMDDVFNFVQFTNDYYGGNGTQQSNIVFVNGSIDPWHWLSILIDNAKLGLYSVFIEGTAHCADLRAESDSDTTELKEARQKIASLVGQFLEQAVRH